MDFIKKNMWGVGFGVILLGAFLAMFFASKHTGLPPASGTAQSKVDIVISAQDHTQGPANAKAVLVEYADFQCPACAAYYPWIEQLKKDFPNDLLDVYRYFPLRQIHFQGENSAEVAEAAGLQGKFWEMYNALYSDQQKWAVTSGKSPFDTYAQKIGLDMNKFASDVNSSAVKDRIDSDLNQGISIGINATPTFYLNGTKIEPNPQNYNEFKALIETAIGTPSGSVTAPISTSTIQLGS